MAKVERLAVLSRRAASLWPHRRALGAITWHADASFSQYGEDILFDRLLKPGDRGTYLDDGANHPIYGSNTYRLYMRGWDGVAIDPNPQFAPLFARHRPRDRYLTAGVSREDGELTYFQFGHHVFNTLDTDRATELITTGHAVVGRIEVPCRPLSTIIAETLGNRQIDLATVDCEGMDLEVLRSIDLDTTRPTVFILEDYGRYLSFRDGSAAGSFERTLRAWDYVPIAQTAWSSIFVAADWKRLFALSDAFAAERMDNGYMPGQATANEVAPH